MLRRLFGILRCLRNYSLVHCWDNIQILNLYSLLGLGTLKNVKCYPTMTKFKDWGLGRVEGSVRAVNLSLAATAGGGSTMTLPPPPLSRGTSPGTLGFRDLGFANPKAANARKSYE